MRQVIFNADDLGFSPSISKSIVLAYDAGALKSTTLLVCREATRAAVEMAKARPGLDIGLHLDLDEFFQYEEHGHYGTTIDDIPAEIYRFQIAEHRAALERAVREQIERYLGFGLTLSHLDGHHHAHLLPDVLPFVVEIAEEYGIDKMRFSRGFYGTREDEYQACKRILDQASIKYPDFCLAIDDQLPIGTILGRLGDGVTELVIHTDLPGNDENDWRIRQFEYLVGPDAVSDLARHGVAACTYACLR